MAANLPTNQGGGQWFGRNKGRRGRSRAINGSFGGAPATDAT